jgi:hypothetical protein
MFTEAQSMDGHWGSSVTNLGCVQRTTNCEQSELTLTLIQINGLTAHNYWLIARSCRRNATIDRYMPMTTSFRLIAIHAETEMRSLARRYVADCIVTALDLEPTRPWFLFETKTDAERDLLRGDETLLKELKAVFRARECPDAIVQRLMFSFQSLETVERDYAGNWRWALQ